MLLGRLVAAEDGNLTRGISLSPRAEHSPARPRPFVKDLSKRQLKDLLEDVYLSKARSDARCVRPCCILDNHAAKTALGVQLVVAQTMSCHMDSRSGS